MNGRHVGPRRTGREGLPTRPLRRAGVPGPRGRPGGRSRPGPGRSRSPLEGRGRTPSPLSRPPRRLCAVSPRGRGRFLWGWTFPFLSHTRAHTSSWTYKSSSGKETLSLSVRRQSVAKVCHDLTSFVQVVGVLPLRLEDSLGLRRRRSQSKVTWNDPGLRKVCCWCGQEESRLWSETLSRCDRCLMGLLCLTTSLPPRSRP